MMAISSSTSASMKMTEINNSQITSQEEVEDFFKNNSTWSLLKFLQYRARTESFTYDKDKEHMLYRSALIGFSDEQAQSCLLAFEREKISQSVENFWNGNIEKNSLGYINEIIDDSVRDSKAVRTFLSNELGSFVTSSKERDCSHAENSQDHSNFHTPDHNEETRTDMSNVSLNEYINAINAINGNLVERVGRMTNILAKKSKIFME